MTLRITGTLAALALLAAAAAPPANAGLRYGEFDVGLRAGTAASTISGLNGIAEDRTYGPMGGLSVGYHFDEWIAVDSGVMYSEKGGEGLGADASGTPTKFVTRLDYVTIPLRVRVPMGPGPVLPYFAVGFEYSVLVAAETWFATDESDKTDAKDQFKDSDFGTAVAIGLEIPVSRIVLVVEGGWTRGLTDVAETGGLEGKNGTVQLIGGITFPIGGIRRR
jgi:hypothetical protein